MRVSETSRLNDDFQDAELDTPRRARTREKLRKWQKGWKLTQNKLSNVRQTGVPLIAKQDCYKQVIQKLTLDDFHFDASLSSGLISEKLLADYDKNFGQSRTTKNASG